MSEVHKFQQNFYSHYNLLDPVLDSYNQVAGEEIQNIFTNFGLRYRYFTQEKDHEDEELLIGLKFSNLNLTKPGQSPKLAKTPMQAVASRQDYMCIYEFDTTFTIKLVNDKKQQQKLRDFVHHIMMQQNIKEFDEKNQSVLLDKFFEKYQQQYDAQEQIEIPCGKFSFQLPVMTGSIMDPLTDMSPRQRYDLGCDVNERGGDIILAGIPYLIQNGYGYPYNQPIVAKSTLDNQLIRVDYIYQPDPVYSNYYQSIFLLIQTKIKKQKQFIGGATNDLVLNFKQRVDFNFRDTDNYIPISLLFRAYGCDNDVKLLKYCNQSDNINESLFFIELFQEGSEHKKYMSNRRRFSQLEALFEIGKIISKNNKCDTFQDVFNITKVAKDGLSKYVSPIIVGQESPYCQTLGEICHSIYLAHTQGIFTDRDALYNKRVQMIGFQMVGEFRSKMNDGFKSCINSIKSQINQYPFKEIKEQPSKILHSLESMVSSFGKQFTKDIKKQFTSTQGDNVKIQKNLNEQKSAYLSVSSKREIIIKPSTSNGKVGYDQRKVQKSHFYFICYLTTPESGVNIGRYLSITIYSYVTIPQKINKVQSYLQTNPLFKTVRQDGKKYMAVKINHNTVGFVEHGKSFKDLYDQLINWRRENAFLKKGKIESICEEADQLFITIYYSIKDNVINICTDGGRIVIPIFNRKFKDTDDFADMIRSGEAQYIDPSMIQNFIVEEYTEIGKNKNIKWYVGPSGGVGILPGVNPFQNHNKGTRSSLSTAQMKSPQCQCISNWTNYYSKNLLVNNENHLQIIYAPLVDVLFKDVTTTQMVYMAVMPYTDNQEDAMIICEDFVSRYGFATTSFQTYTSEKVGTSEEFAISQQVRKEYNYSKIDQTQFQITKMGMNIKMNDVLIAKVKQLENMKIDQSVVYEVTQKGEYACVSNVNRFTFDPIANLKIVRVALGRLPSIGDKVASINAQKSTIGKILPGYMMPITDEGIIINLLQDNNPIIKRETYGQELELLCSRHMLEHNVLRLQISQDQPIEFMDQLGSLEYDSMYRPDNDELFQNPKVLCGTMNYTVQKHVVDEKIRVRGDEGKQDQISKQSSIGKKTGGGLKIGDQERQDIAAAGGSHILPDFFGKLSSNIQYPICMKCGGTYVHYDKVNTQHMCRCCGLLQDNDVMINGYSYNAIFMNHILFACGAQQNFIMEK